MFDLVHNLSHPFIHSTRKLISSKFIWTGLQKQVGTWAKECIACQAAKIQTHIKALLETFKIPSCRFDHIHVDLMGPLPPSKGFTHLFTVVDHFSRWPEATPQQHHRFQLCSSTGIPLDCTFWHTIAHLAGQRFSFTSQLWSAVAKMLGTQLHHTTAYHPQSNGLVKRWGSLSPKVHSTSPTHWPQLDTRTTMGPPRHPNST